MVFGVPVAAFGFQVAMVRPYEYGAAWSALALAVFYLVLASAMFRPAGQGMRLLVESFIALCVAFGTLAVPLAFEARLTSATWALEGAAVVWVGLRQARLLPRVFGYALQFPAGFAFLLDVGKGYGATPQDGKVRVSTMLLHTSGQWIADDMLLTPRDESPQALGSCVTYGRRYALAAIAGVAPEEDDGEAAQGRGPQPIARPVPVDAPTVPEGYDDWWADMTSTADVGVDALADAWERSPKAMQAYTVRAKKQAWETLKARARAVTGDVVR